MKIAIWARVSSQEQDASTQLEPLRTLAAQLGGEIVYEYVLNESATGKRGRRKEFDLMMQDAARRRFDLLLFYNLSRFSREGVRKTIHYLERLDSHGVRFKSLQEPLLDTDNEMIR
ncbi:MAG: recombinase family protein [Deinococcota bacterium]|nr:recombinase family protein [Deinococcota bacterium]